LSFTDDSALNEYAGIPVAIVAGSQNNFKITTEEDYERAKSLAAMMIQNVREENRCGTGFDVHAFRERKKDENNFIRICGIDVEFDKKIEAHSDGDVGIHALIDAILGAIGDNRRQIVVGGASCQRGSEPRTQTRLKASFRRSLVGVDAAAVGRRGSGAGRCGRACGRSWRRAASRPATRPTPPCGPPWWQRGCSWPASPPAPRSNGAAAP
jgi:hypothetical protein